MSGNNTTVFAAAQQQLTRWGTGLARAVGQRRFAAVQSGMFDRLMHFPRTMPPALVVFGGGPMTPVLTAQAAEIVRDNPTIERVYLTGGAVMAQTSFAAHLLPRMEKAGHPAPQPQEIEAHYMERALRARLAQLGGRSAPLDILLEPLGRNTGENCRNVGQGLGAEKEPALGLMVLPYHALRTMATWRRQVSAEQPLKPIMAWPSRELGITPNNWQQSALALAVVAGETGKILGDNPDYVRKGFCAQPDPSRDHALYQRYCAERQMATRPGAATALPSAPVVP